METLSKTLFIEFQTINCSQCGVMFALQSGYRQGCVETHRSFYCPNGHSNYYPAETDKERLERQLRIANDDKTRLGEMLQQKEKELLKTKQRVSKGVCPCCNRYFKNVHRHMESKHPKYK